MTARLLFAALFAGAAIPAAAAPAPASTFFQNCELARPSLAPDGTHVLAHVNAPGGRDSLVVVELATMKPTVVARYRDADVGFAKWLNDQRIAYVLWKTDVRLTKTLARMVAVDRDGGGVQSFGDAIVDPESFLSYCGAGAGGTRDIIDPFDGKSDDLLVKGVYEGHSAPFRMNTQNGSGTNIIAPPRAIHWLMDDSFTLRVVVTREGKQNALHFREENGTWRKVATFADTNSERIRPVLYANKTLYVHARNGTDKRSVYRYNLQLAKLDGEPVVTSPDFDMAGEFVTDDRKALGYRYLSDAYETVWFDKGMQALQKEVDALFPDTVNAISVGSRSKTPYILVSSGSAMQPPVFRIYNRETKLVSSLGRALPAIVPSDMVNMEMKRYPARDGLLIPAYLALPNVAVKKNLPMVIIVKPDPWSRRAVWGWTPAVQFLASRGYAVLQPETRGTDGFGAAFQEAGLKQWGRAMQDDLADGAKWAVAQGIADPARICILGAGYGGYAAAMGLINDGNLFRCGISLNGIVDLEKTVTRPFQDLGTMVELQEKIGHPVKDAAQLRATSPLANARRIGNPMLLAYGAEDSEVPAGDGQALYDAIKTANPASEFHLFDKKGQGWSRENNGAQLWMRIEQFLEKNNGKR